MPIGNFNATADFSFDLCVYICLFLQMNRRKEKFKFSNLFCLYLFLTRLIIYMANFLLSSALFRSRSNFTQYKFTVVIVRKLFGTFPHINKYRKIQARKENAVDLNLNRKKKNSKMKKNGSSAAYFKTSSFGNCSHFLGNSMGVFLLKYFCIQHFCQSSTTVLFCR